MTNTKLQISEFFSENQLSVARAESDETVGIPILVFASAGEGAREARKREFIGTLSELKRPLLFVRDESRSWYSSTAVVENIRRVVEDEMARNGVDKVDTIGTSMGGYAALALGAVLPIRNALAFVPRFSPDPRIVWDPRHQIHLSKISSTLEISTAHSGCSEADQAMIIHGLYGPDLRHVRAYAEIDPPDHWVFLEPSHFVAQILRDSGQLAPLVNAVVSSRPRLAREILRKSGALKAKRVLKLLDPMISGYAAQCREELDVKGSRPKTIGSRARLALGKAFGGKKIFSSASDNRRKE